MEKRKREVTVIRRDTAGAGAAARTLAIVLIAVGVVFLLINLGLFSWDSVGSFFGAVGRFFGGLGGEIGRFFGGLGRALAGLWPLVLIGIGALLLLRRSNPASQDDADHRDS